MKRFQKNVALKTKAAEPHNREALPPFVRYAQAEHVCLLGNYRRHVRHLGQALRKTWALEK